MTPILQFGVIEKLTSACYFKFARENMLLLVNNIKEKREYTQFETRIHATQLYLHRDRSPSLFP